MSLINNLLQDLDNRLADQSEDLALPRHARAVAAPVRRRGWTVAAVFLLLLFSCAIFAAVYLWKTDLRFKSKVDHLLATVGVVESVPDTPPTIPETVQASVEAALMVPVFQMSNELGLSPVRSQAASPDKKPDTSSAKTQNAQEQVLSSNRDAMGEKPVAMRDSKSNGSASRIVSAKPESAQKKLAVQGKSAAKEKVTIQAKPDSQVESTPAAQTKAIVEPTKIPDAISERDADATTNQPVTDQPEEVVIPADLTSSPIERQARALTAYERAENEFLKGVGHIRQGRMKDAEASFRSAIVEDRSHVSARQALIGILIEAGRSADAEAVLIEALSINPRQPQQAMILARLQVERGDLPTAVLTLERAREYATSDAGFISFHAAVLQRAARHGEAATQYRNALALVQENAIWSMGLGISLRALEDTASAKDAFRAAATSGTLSKDLQAYVEQQLFQLNRGLK